MATMRLYDSTLSGNCYKVRLLLAHLGIPYERVEVDIQSREGRRELLGEKTPILRVPVLELEDGRALAESNAILWHLARDTDYLPADPFERTRVLQWLFFEQNNHEPNLAVARYWVTILGRADEYAQALRIRREAGRVALGVMEGHLSDHPFFVADRYTIADVALYPYTSVAHEAGIELEPFPAVRRWLSRVSGQPGHVAMRMGPAPTTT